MVTKKEYLAPEVEIVKIGTMQMMAASVGFGEDLDSATGAEAPALPGMPDLGIPGVPGVPSLGFPFE